jgi:hypothetical protein
MNAQFQIGSETVRFTVGVPAPERTTVTRRSSCPKSKTKVITLELERSEPGEAFYRVANIEPQLE